MSDVVYATCGLVDGLCELAGEREPDSVTISIAVTPAGEFAADLPSETPVFTHFYFSEAGGSLAAVFGMDLGTPAGQTQGRFVSHPQGSLQVTQTDDLHGVVFVAVPPWGRESVAAFSRNGIRRSLSLVDAEPETEFPFD